MTDAAPPPPRRGPIVIDLAETALPPAPAPADAPPPDEADSSAARALAAAARPRPVSLLGRLLWSGLGVFVALWAGTAAEAYVSRLIAEAPLLGWLAAGALAVTVLALAGLALREAAAIARLGRIAGLRASAAAAAAGDGAALTATLAGLARLYPATADTVAEAAAERPGDWELLAIAERTHLATRDAEAERAVRDGARAVAAATALVPTAIVDMVAVLAVNLRMIRRIGEIYGGRSGWIGGLRLLRAVAQHLVASGLIAAGDDLLGPLVGGGVLGRLSRRFGEAAVNAGLTARVGVAAIEVCRPLPFAARGAPRASGVLMAALADWRAPADPPGR